MDILLGILIGVIISLIGLIIKKIITSVNRSLRHQKNSRVRDFIDPLIYLLIDNKIIKDGTRFFIDAKKNCIYLFIDNKIKQYAYKDEHKNEFIEINNIEIPERLANVLREHFMYSDGLIMINYREAHFISFDDLGTQHRRNKKAFKVI